MANGLPDDGAIAGTRETAGEPATEAATFSPRQDASSVEALAAGLYEELRKAARRERRRAGRPLTWNTTALIHETYVKLYRRQAWSSREQFMGFAATAMRHVLVDAARARLTRKRGAGAARVSLDLAEQVGVPQEDQEIVRLGDALGELSKFDPQLAQLVECRFFAGLDEEETGRILGVSDRTVRRRWTQARAWLHREMQDVA
jgi:RNA polymerase sigma factor (TIGR02999 family)